MFPIKTDKQNLIANSTEKEVEVVLQNRIHKKKLIQITNDNEFYGKVKPRHSKFELGQFPSRNSFRPIVVMTWRRDENITVIESYFRLDKRITLTFLILPLYGVYLSIIIQMLLPFIVTSLFTIILFVVIHIAYKNGKKSTKEKLLAIFDELKP